MSSLAKQSHHHHDHCRPGFPHPIPGPFTRSKYGVQLQRDYNFEYKKYECKCSKNEVNCDESDEICPGPNHHHHCHHYRHHEHLKKKASDLNVGIVGGGMAGLYAALLLQDLGIKSHLFEANNRLGGRVYTKRFAGYDGSDPTKGAFYNYVDVGESRVPVMDIMDRFTGKHKHYSLINVLNRHNHNKGEVPIEMIPYINEHASNLKLFNGQKLTIKELEHEKCKHEKCCEKEKLFDPFHFGTKHGGPVPEQYLSEPHEKQLAAALALLVKTLESDKVDFSKSFEGLKKVDALSVRAFLAGHAPKDFNRANPLPAAVVNWIETLSTSTDRFEYAFTEFLLNHFEYGKHLLEENKDHKNKEIKWECVEGGMDRFVDVLEKHLLIRSSSAHRTDNNPEGSEADTGEEGTDAIISKGLKVVSIAPDSSDRHKLAITPVNSETGDAAPVESFDHVINATPLSIMRNMDMSDCDLSFLQREAIRAIHYETAVQVSMNFKTRFWEEEHEGAKKSHHHPHLIGGASRTDNPLRTVIYPSYGGKLADGEKAPGVLIASHTHIQDAIRMSSLTGGTGDNTSEDPYAARRNNAVNDLCLKYLAELHGEKIRDEYTNEFHVMDWGREEFQQGAKAHFGPGQFSHYYPALVRPAAHGRLHFAGEATSVHHGWVVGSLNSAYRAVYQILKHEGLDMEIDMLIGHWGVVDEVDYRADECYKAQKKEQALAAKQQNARSASPDPMPTLLEDVKEELGSSEPTKPIPHDRFSTAFEMHDVYDAAGSDEEEGKINKKIKKVLDTPTSSKKKATN